MNPQLVVCISTFVLLLWAKLCASRPSKIFAPAHHCNVGILCNSTKNYPEEEIKKIVERSKKKFSSLSGSVIEPAENQLVPQIRTSEEDFEETNMCKTKRVTVLPKTGFDVEMNLRYIVNVRGFEQMLTYDICVHPNGKCFGEDFLPNDFKTFCKQTFNVVRLVSVSNTGKLEYGRFTIPSGCVCSYKKDSIFI